MTRTRDMINFGSQRIFLCAPQPMYWVRGGVIEWFCKKRIARFLWDHFCSHLCTTTSLHYTACHNLCMYCCWSAVQNSKCKQIWHTMSTRKGGGCILKLTFKCIGIQPAGVSTLCISSMLLEFRIFSWILSHRYHRLARTDHRGGGPAIPPQQGGG